MHKKKILFEAGPMLDRNKTGVGYYISHLMTSLQSQYSDRIELNGYFFNFLGRRQNIFPADRQIRFSAIRFIPGKIISVCRRLGFQPWLELFIRQRAEAVIFTNYVSLPKLRKAKTALVVYDMSYLDVPEYTQAINLSYLKRFCSPSIRRADLIITISEFTRQRLIHYFPDVESRVIVTPIPPPENQIKTLSLTSELISQGISAHGYILYLGTVEPRKNIESLMIAYSKLDADLRDRYALVLAGGKGWKDESILTAATTHRAKGLNIILPGYVTEAEKNTLYSNAACFVLPSHYEGFGMPILEAMQYGIACAVSDIDIFHEVAGEAAIYFDKDDPTDMSEKISSLLSSSVLREKLIQKGDRQLARFSWKENATKVYQALN